MEKDNKERDEFAITIHNRMHREIYITWIDPLDNNRELDLGKMADNELREFKTWEGHIWNVRDTKTHEILQTIKIKYPGPYVLLPQPFKEKADEVTKRNYVRFLNNYKEKCGIDWITVYPRCKTVYPLLDPIEKGAMQSVKTSATYFNQNTNEQEIEIETFGIRPRIFLVKQFLNEFEVSSLIDMSKGRLERSTIVSDDGSGLIESDMRTSSTCWLRYSESALVENIFDRISDILKMDRNYVKYQGSEALQIVHYSESQQFKHHHDYLDPDAHVGNNSVMRGNNRLATFLIYLHTPEKGGETDFPLSDAGENGLKVKLEPGSAVLFYDMLPDGNLDEKSFHAGLPVEKGEKCIANLWVWDRVYK